MMGPDARLAAESTDFVQEVMTDLIRRRAATPLENDQTLLRWMTSIARNKIRDALRRRHEQSFSTFFETLGDSRSQKTPSEEVSQREHLDRLAEGLEALESEHRVVIELRALEGFSFREIGNRLDKSEEAARKQFGRAILRLGEVMRPERENR
jgi:RNA polymerase sigma-70 factor (ECF subfamily)